MFDSYSQKKFCQVYICLSSLILTDQITKFVNHDDQRKIKKEYKIVFLKKKKIENIDD